MVIVVYILVCFCIVKTSLSAHRCIGLPIVHCIYWRAPQLSCICSFYVILRYQICFPCLNAVAAYNMHCMSGWIFVLCFWCIKTFLCTSWWYIYCCCMPEWIFLLWFWCIKTSLCTSWWYIYCCCRCLSRLISLSCTSPPTTYWADVLLSLIVRPSYAQSSSIICIICTI